MWRWLALGTLFALPSVGCTAPGPRLGPPPEPFLATRPPRQPAAVPPPFTVEQGPGAPNARAARSHGAQTLRGRTIVVDAGHGGKDPGALGRGPSVEKNINLEIALHLADDLQERGATVVMTRRTDRFIELAARAAVADRTRCDLFVSIHADSSPKSDREGITAYIARGTGGYSLQAANHIGTALRRAGFEFHGVQGKGYRVLVDHSRPAVLVECGYVTNRMEARRLADDSYRERLADAIAEGIVDHFAK